MDDYRERITLAGHLRPRRWPSQREEGTKEAQEVEEAKEIQEAEEVEEAKEVEVEERKRWPAGGRRYGVIGFRLVREPDAAMTK